MLRTYCAAFACAGMIRVEDDFVVEGTSLKPSGAMSNVFMSFGLR